MQNSPAHRLCVRCKTSLQHNQPFCSLCGTQQPQLAVPILPKSGQSAWSVTTIVLVCSIVGSCALCGLFGAIVKKDDKPQTSVTNTASKPTPTPTPEITNAEKLKDAKNLIFDEATETQLNEAKTLILSIPKEAKEYKDAQKQVVIINDFLMDLALMGERPTTAPARTFLRHTLNDYDSSEFLEWSSVLKIKIKDEPYWFITLKLRAKNAFGAYIIKDVTFYMRQNQVVKVEGL